MFKSFSLSLRPLSRSVGLRSFGLAAAAMFAAVTAQPATAQMQSVDPDAGIDGDLSPSNSSAPPMLDQVPPPAGGWPSQQTPVDTAPPPAVDPSTTYGSDYSTQPAPTTTVTTNTTTPQPSGQTYQKDDLIGAAEGVFGKGAHGLANVIEDILAKQGEPNGYIAGREGGGALVVGLRYGSGTLYHKVEGQRPVYWTGPSIGFDAGANAGSTFVLVYNLYDTQDLYKRFAAGEGQAYLIGGFNVSYLRRGNVVLIPVRVGVGMRLGINAGYMKFTQNQTWLPF